MSVFCVATALNTFKELNFRFLICSEYIIFDSAKGHTKGTRYSQDLTVFSVKFLSRNIAKVV